MADATPDLDALAHERLLALGDLARLGIRMAQALERHVLCAEEVQVHQARTDPDVMVMPACDLAGVAQGFSRISRAVRMTFALQARLERQLRQGGPPASCSPAPRQTRPAARLPADRDGEARESAEHLLDPEDPLQLPEAEIVARICRALGLPPQEAAAIQARWAAPAEPSLPFMGRDRSRSDQGGEASSSAGAQDRVIPRRQVITPPP